MPDLDEEEQKVLKEMLTDWGNMKRTIKTLAWIGSILGWVVGIGSGILVFWDQFFHGKTH